MSKKKVAAAMSGGVDSSVAAALLCEEGYEVMGMTLELGIGHEKSGSGADSVRLARETAEQIGIPHRTVDAKREFEAGVVEDFCREYARGRTPNPCIRCNRLIKFGMLWEAARSLGAEFLATGHHARIERDPERGIFRLLKGNDGAKDQSYFLYVLGQEELGRTLFPVGELRKAEVRAKAEALKVGAARRPESQEICFIPDNDYVAFLRARNPEAFLPGLILDAAGNRLGGHSGIIGFTVGQRRGLGIAAPHPLYVLELRHWDNAVVVGPADKLLRRELAASEMRWIDGIPPDKPFPCRARIRYRHREAEAEVFPQAQGSARVVFDAPQRAISPGQAVVFYSGDEVLGGGVIDSVVSE